jgi:hypothetical protein
VESKGDTEEEANCSKDASLTEAHYRVRVLGMRKKRRNRLSLALPVLGMLNRLNISTFIHLQAFDQEWLNGS